MQILLHADPHTDGSAPMAEHLSAAVGAALGRFGARVSRVEAHLSDANGATRSGGSDIHCTLEARLHGEQVVIAKERAATAHQAIAGALRKLKRGVGAEIARHDPRRERPPADAAGNTPAGTP